MAGINIGANIASLRKNNNVTQEQMAQALNISSQAVSKWETNTCLPDTMMLPLIAKFFNVSVDYLYYGKDVTYDDIYDKNYQKISAFGQLNGFEEALRLYAPIHHGLSCGNLHRKRWLNDEASHISGENGLSLLSGKGYAAIITKHFFQGISKKTAEFAEPVLKALSEKRCVEIVMAVVSMSDISYNELKEKVKADDVELRSSLKVLTESKIIIEKVSKHKMLGTTYEISEMYHTCVCVLLATLEMQRDSIINGISCCMGFGDYPIKL